MPLDRTRTARLPRRSRIGRNGTARDATASPARRASCRGGRKADRDSSGRSATWDAAGRRRSSSATGLYITGDVDDDLVIFAFDLDGKPLWQAKNGRSWTGSYPGARACCAYSEGKLYHMNAHGRVACLEAATGKELWAVDVLERFQGQNITWAMSECLLVDGPRVIVTPGGEKALMAALDKQNGRTLWTTEPLREDRASHCSPLLFRHAGRRIVANCSSAHGFARGCRHRQAALDGAAAKPVRSQRRHAGLRRRQHLLHDSLRLRNVLPVAAGQRRAAAREGVEHDPGHLHGHGAAAWTACSTAAATRSTSPGSAWIGSPGETRYEFKGLTTGAAVYADGRLYCLAEDGRAALLRPTPERFEIDGQFRLVPEKVPDAWAHPVLLHGRLYLRYHDTLWCYDVRPYDKRKTDHSSKESGWSFSRWCGAFLVAVRSSTCCTPSS